MRTPLWSMTVTLNGPRRAGEGLAEALEENHAMTLFVATNHTCQ